MYEFLSNAYCCFIYRNLIEDIVGNDVVKDFKEKHMDDYFDLVREFEAKKRSNYNQRMQLKVPVSINEIFKEKNDGKSVHDHISSKAKYKGRVTWKTDKVLLKPEVVMTLFEQPCRSAADHLKSLFREKELEDVPTILMVGGFSESLYLLEAVKRTLPEKRLVVPMESGLAVLMGAVIFGHDPSIVQERRCRYTYGVRMASTFDENNDPEEMKLIDDDGEVLCTNKFDVHVRVDQTASQDKEQAWKSYYVLRKNQTSINFDCFATTEVNPNLTTDYRCKKIGTLTVTVPGSGMGRSVKFRIVFSDTELHAEAVELQKLQKTEAKLNFLG